MFSIMMTVESTTMPKSTAPSEMRFADVRVATRPMNAMSSASGMLMRRDERRSRVPEEDEEDRRDERHPDEQVLDHRVRRDLHERRRGRSTARCPFPAAGCGSARM